MHAQRHRTVGRDGPVGVDVGDALHNRRHQRHRRMDRHLAVDHHRAVLGRRYGAHVAGVDVAVVEDRIVSKRGDRRILIVRTQFNRLGLGDDVILIDQYTDLVRAHLSAVILGANPIGLDVLVVVGGSAPHVQLHRPVKQRPVRERHRREQAGTAVEHIPERRAFHGDRGIGLHDGQRVCQHVVVVAGIRGIVRPIVGAFYAIGAVIGNVVDIVIRADAV